MVSERHQNNEQRSQRAATAMSTLKPSSSVVARTGHGVSFQNCRHDTRLAAVTYVPSLRWICLQHPPTATNTHLDER